MATGIGSDANPVQDKTSEQKEKARQVLRNTHIGLYLSIRFVAVYFTLTMIATFLAETILNTVRLNQSLASHGVAWLKESILARLFAKFYPDGSTPVVLISGDLVIVYLFAVAIYAVVRFTYQKAVRDDGTDLHSGGLTWESLKNQGQSLVVRLCWYITPRNGVHKKVFMLWMLYVFFLGITIALTGLVGISVYLSPQLKYALYGSGIAFGIGLLEDIRFFKKIPPKEAILAALVAIIEGTVRRDPSGTIKRLSGIVKETNDYGLREVEEILNALIVLVKERQEQKDQIIYDKDRRS